MLLDVVSHFEEVLALDQRSKKKTSLTATRTIRKVIPGRPKRNYSLINHIM